MTVVSVVRGVEQGTDDGDGAPDDEDCAFSDLTFCNVVDTVLTAVEPDDWATGNARSPGGSLRCSWGGGAWVVVLRTVYCCWPPPGLTTFCCGITCCWTGGGGTATSSWLWLELAEPDVFRAITGCLSGCSTATPGPPLNTAATVPNRPIVATLAAASAILVLLISSFPANESPSVDGTIRNAALARSVAQTSFSSAWSCEQDEQVSRWARIRRSSTPWTPPAVYVPSLERIAA